MAQQVPGILVDAVGPRALESLLPIAAGQQSDPERASTTRGEQIPDAIADNHSTTNLGTKPISRREEQVGVRLRVLDLITCHHWHRCGIKTQCFESRSGVRHLAAGGNAHGTLDSVKRDN